MQPLSTLYDTGFGRIAPLLPHQLDLAEAQRIANNMLSFQTPSEGWSKRTNIWRAPRQSGQQFGVEPDYIPAFYNEATSVQLRWLAAFYPKAGGSIVTPDPTLCTKGHKLYPTGPIPLWWFCSDLSAAGWLSQCY